MKLVNLTAADLEQFKQSLPKEQPAPPAFHRDQLQVDALAIELARPAASEDPKTNTYSITFRGGDSEYVIIVRPTIHGVPSITLDIITRAGDKAVDAEFSSYTVLRETVTTLKGRVSGLPTSGSLDLAAMLEHLKVQ